MSASANGSAQLRKWQKALLTKRLLSAIWQLEGRGFLPAGWGPQGPRGWVWGCTSFLYGPSILSLQV